MEKISIRSFTTYQRCAEQMDSGLSSPQGQLLHGWEATDGTQGKKCKWAGL